MRAFPTLLAVALIGLAPDLLAAQEMTNLPASSMGTQSLRPYWHVFIAYAIAIAMVLGWVISIAKRMGALESRISEGHG